MIATSIVLYGWLCSNMSDKGATLSIMSHAKPVVTIFTPANGGSYSCFPKGSQMKLDDVMIFQNEGQTVCKFFDRPSDCKKYDPDKK
jgi:hypothetical protein